MRPARLGSSNGRGKCIKRFNACNRRQRLPVELIGMGDSKAGHQRTSV
jgi:hypothetical protein